MYSIGVDIGGTFIKCGIVKDGKIVARDKVPTIKENNESKVLGAVKSLMDSLLSSLNAGYDKVDNIGIGVAGLCESGVVKAMANVAWTDMHFEKKLGKMCGVKVTIANDLKAATLGELNYGIGKKCKDFVFLALGTGLNCGVIKDKFVIDGIEFGHTIIDREGGPCGCGMKGCLEAAVSSKSLLAYAKKHGVNSSDIKEIFELSKVDKNCKDAILEYIDALGIGLVNICNSYRPKMIVLGGGIGEGLNNYIDVVNGKLKQYNYGYKGAKEVKVVVSKIGNNCGILGASTLK